MFLSIPEGVSVMTVIIDGVDAVPCGCGETFISFPGAPDAPGGHYDLRAARQLGSPVRTGPKCNSGKQKQPQKRGRSLRQPPDHTTGTFA
jgi:hypothetical protein